jgi:hypothetical protein
MLQHETTKDRSILPKPLALTPNEVQQVAAGTAASLSELIKMGGATWGLWPPPGPIEVAALPSLAKN